MGSRKPQKVDKKKKSEYFKKYWSKHGEKINLKRRTRYNKDTRYRKRIIEHGKAKNVLENRRRRKLRLDKLRQKRKSLEQSIKYGHVRKLMPRKVIIKGTPTKVYPQLALTEAIGIDRHTLYRWRSKNVLPKPSFVDSNNRNWYTKEYIDNIFQVFEDIKGDFYFLEELKEELQTYLPNMEWSDESQI